MEPLVGLAFDHDWVIRWCVAEKLGDLKDERAINALVALLGDSDFHVIKNASKALQKFGIDVIPKLLPLFAHPHYKVREVVFSLIESFGEKALPDLIKALPTYSWVVANRISHLIFVIGKQESEDYLIEALVHPVVQKNTIIMLGMLRSKISIPHVVRMYDNPGLKRVILYSFKLIGKQSCFPILVKLLQNKGLRLNTGKLILKIGPAILPYLVEELGQTKTTKKMIVLLMDKIGPYRVMDKVHLLSKQDKEISILTRDLRLKFPYKKRVSEQDGQSGFWQSLFT